LAATRLWIRSAVLGIGNEVQTQAFDDYPENAPSDLIVVEARFGVLGMVVTPTCHVSKGEKDEDIVSVVPVEALNLVVPELKHARNVREGNNVLLHMFPLPRTELGEGILRFDGVALLDRPASMLEGQPARPPAPQPLASSRASPSARHLPASRGRCGL